MSDMSFWDAWSMALAPILALAVAAWLVSLARRNAGVVDSFWSLFFLAAVATVAFSSDHLEARGLLVTLLVAVWALRLSTHITIRNFGEDEDRRYRAMREKHEPGFAWKSLGLVFGLQAFLAWIISVPLLLALLSPAALGPVDMLALTLWSIGFIFEAVGDWQLRRFLADPANSGRVLQSGLWRYTRHPNYFGEACMWWAFWLFAVPAGGWWSVFSPVLMTFLLLRVSGVTLLEKTMSDRRPAYRSYVRRTNAFLPWPPRSEDA